MNISQNDPYKTSTQRAFIILAAGRSTRFPTNKLKTNLAGVQLIDYSLDLANQNASPDNIYLVSTQPISSSYKFNPIYQSQPNGTGGALIAALQQFTHIYSQVTVLLADTPLIKSSTVQSINNKTCAAVMYVNGTYGRLNIQNSIITEVKEHRSDSFDPNEYGYAWSGTVNFNIPSNQLLQLALQLQNKNGEIQLTDLFLLTPTYTHCIPLSEGIGINTQLDFTQAYKFLRQQIIQDAKVLVQDIDTVFIDKLSTLQPGCSIHPHTHIVSSIIKSTATVLPFSYIENSTIEGVVGPFACIKNNSHIDINASVALSYIDGSIVQGIVGPFTHIKNQAHIHEEAQIDCSYIDNATVQGIAGPFTCIKNGAHIHSDANVELSYISNAIVEGDIGPFSHIDNRSHIHKDAKVDCSHINNAEIHGSVGPFACIRDKTLIGRDAQIGAFVDVKNSTIGSGSKAKHLSYIGDATIGENTNIGAGTITCNYNKSKRIKSETIIGSNCDIGANSSLVAPLTIEDNAQVAAGSVITKTVPVGKLAVSRTPQKILRKM